MDLADGKILLFDFEHYYLVTSVTKSVANRYARMLPVLTSKYKGALPKIIIVSVFSSIYIDNMFDNMYDIFNRFLFLA